jgi:hypothetical protein
MKTKRSSDEMNGTIDTAEKGDPRPAPEEVDAQPATARVLLDVPDEVSLSDAKRIDFLAKVARFKLLY